MEKPKLIFYTLLILSILSLMILVYEFEYNNRIDTHKEMACFEGDCSEELLILEQEVACYTGCKYYNDNLQINVLIIVIIIIILSIN